MRFDFLGFHFDPEGFSFVEKTIENFIARASSFTSKSRGEPKGSPLIGLSLRRWFRWARCIGYINLDLLFILPTQSRHTD